MKSRVISEGPHRTFVLTFETGDEVVSGLRDFVGERDITAAQFTDLGALSDVVLGYFDWQRKEYRRVPIQEQVEAVSFLGNVALGEDGRLSVHPHIVISKADASAHGGHLLEAHARPILEIVVTEVPGHLQRRRDPETGLALIRP